MDCPNARQLLTKYDYRVVSVKWTNAPVASYFQTTIKIIGYDEIGMLSNISDVISKDLRVNMRSINIDTNEGIFEGIIKLYVEGIEHLDFLMRKLTQIKGVEKVFRIVN